MTHDTAEIRKLLTDTFDDAGLDAFCLDHYPQVYHQFSRGMLKDEKITLLLNHCGRQPNGYEDLQAALQAREPTPVQPVPTVPAPTSRLRRFGDWMCRILRDPIWQAIGVIVAILACIVALLPILPIQAWLSHPTTTPTLPPSPAALVLLEDFEQAGAAVGLTWWDFGRGTFTYRRTDERAHSGRYALQVSYVKQNTHEFIGAEIPDGPARNLSRGHAVQVWVYGTADILLKLGLADRREFDVSTQTASEPTGWTRLIYDYTTLANRVNLADVRNLRDFQTGLRSPCRARQQPDTFGSRTVWAGRYAEPVSFRKRCSPMIYMHWLRPSHHHIQYSYMHWPCRASSLRLLQCY